MDRTDENYLPERLNLEMVAVEMGLAHLSTQSQLDAIFYHQRDGRLPVKCYKAMSINVQKVADGLEEHFDQAGNLTLLNIGKNQWIETGEDSITPGPIHFVKMSQVAFGFFNYKGEKYYPLDESGMHPVSLKLDIEHIYVEKSALNNFMQRGVEQIPAYADPSSEYFAPELEAAIRLHRDLRIKGECSPQWPMGNRVSKWLQQNAPDEPHSEAKVKRLSAVIGKKK